MKRLEELGCPSVWLGYSGIPERLYSPSMADLAENEVFTNFVVSAMVNQQGKCWLLPLHLILFCIVTKFAMFRYKCIRNSLLMYHLS